MHFSNLSECNSAYTMRCLLPLAALYCPTYNLPVVWKYIVSYNRVSFADYILNTTLFSSFSELPSWVSALCIVPLIFSITFSYTATFQMPLFCSCWPVYVSMSPFNMILPIVFLSEG